MKMFRISSLIIGALLIMALLVSCEKSNKYSCDTKIENFVTTSAESFEGITRAELCKYSIDTAKGIYNSLTPENRYNIWKEKLEYMLSEGSEYNLTEKESEFIHGGLNDLKVNFFTEKGLADLSLYGDSLCLVAEATLAWDRKRLGRVFATPYTYKELAGTTFSEVPLPNGDGGSSEGGRDCNCATDNLNHCWNVCGYYPDCKQGSKGKGCGILWQYPCNGKCQPE